MSAVGYTTPPGLVGEIADYIYCAAPRPVHEIALAGALGLMAGVTGRAFNVSGTGLNQYILLLAPTGTGKEAIASGINRLISALQTNVPAIHSFVGPSSIASEQALVKHLSNVTPCFVSMVGEFGITLRQICAPNANGIQIGLRRALLDLYNKSGRGHFLHPLIYSDKDKNTATVASPAFSLLGESTPESFYDTLTEHMIAEGLLPRFTTIEYYGPRPPGSKIHKSAEPSPSLIYRMTELASAALTLMQQGRTIEIQFDEEGQKLMDDFDAYCDGRINDAPREVIRQLWNRAHIKALKLAGCVAVGQNTYQPIVTRDIAMWATTLAYQDAANLVRRFEAGDVGKENIEVRQQEAVINAIAQYVRSSFEEIAGYSVPQALHGDKVVPMSFVMRKVHKAVVFREDRSGSTLAIQRTIKSLLEQGVLVELNRMQAHERFGFNGRCFMITDMSVLRLKP